MPDTESVEDAQLARQRAMAAAMGGKWAEKAMQALNKSRTQQAEGGVDVPNAGFAQVALPVSAPSAAISIPGAGAHSRVIQRSSGPGTPTTSNGTPGTDYDPSSFMERPSLVRKATLRAVIEKGGVEAAAWAAGRATQTSERQSKSMSSASGLGLNRCASVAAAVGRRHMEGFGSLGGPAGLAGIHEDHDAAPDFERTTMPERGRYSASMSHSGHPLGAVSKALAADSRPQLSSMTSFKRMTSLFRPKDGFGEGSDSGRERCNSGRPVSEVDGDSQQHQEGGLQKMLRVMSMGLGQSRGVKSPTVPIFTNESKSVHAGSVHSAEDMAAIKRANESRSVHAGANYAYKAA